MEKVELQATLEVLANLMGYSELIVRSCWPNPAPDVAAYLEGFDKAVEILTTFGEKSDILDEVVAEVNFRLQEKNMAKENYGDRA